jgi:predicted kinase
VDDDVVIVVTGVPGAGKTTLARALADLLRGKLLSLDEIKERLYDASAHQVLGNALRMAAERDLAEQLARCERTPVVDIWAQPGRDTDRVAQLLLTVERRSVIEVLCRVPADVAVDRYQARLRSGPHRPADEETLGRIRTAVSALAPLGVGRCLEVDTTKPVDLPALLRSVVRPGA